MRCKSSARANLIDLLHNSTSTGNLCVIPVLCSSRTLEYVAGRGFVSPTNSLAGVNSTKGLTVN